jgi:Cu-Zn family superoxide dismutase
MRYNILAFFMVLAPTSTVAQDMAEARFVDLSGKESGIATLTQTPAGVLFQIEINGLPPGKWVALHVHENGTCDHKVQHETAGGHFNPTGTEHGYFTVSGPHAGDMPNQKVGSDGRLYAQVLNAMVKLDGDKAAIRGKSLMIHSGPDDYKSQPAGDAGTRQACAVIK